MVVVEVVVATLFHGGIELVNAEYALVGGVGENEEVVGAVLFGDVCADEVDDLPQFIGWKVFLDGAGNEELAGEGIISGAFG